MTRRRVLVVDDEADIREVAQMGLELAAGWEVITASSGEDAVAMAVEAKPDAILLDVMMPGVDGPEALRRLRANVDTHAIPVVFLTAKVHAADRDWLGQFDAQGQLAKPFDPITLADEMSRLVGWGT